MYKSHTGPNLVQVVPKSTSQIVPNLFEMTTLRSWIPAKKLNFDFQNVDFVNLDVQGAELKVLKGFGDLLKIGSNIKTIYTEVNFEEIYIGAPHINEIDDYLSQFNFKREITLKTQHNWGDAIYIRKI